MQRGSWESEGRVHARAERKMLPKGGPLIKPPKAADTLGSLMIDDRNAAINTTIIKTANISDKGGLMKKVVFYGDSNTYGYDPSGMMGGRYPRRSRWTTILAEHLEGEWSVARDGMPGRMIPEAGKGLGYVIDALKAEMPMDLLAVMLGTNDLLTMRRPDASKAAEKMENLIAAAQEALGTDILLIAPMQIRFTDPSCTDPFVRGSGDYAQRCLEESRLLARFYEEIARRRGTYFADASSWETETAFDGVHLTERGNALFAKEMEKMLREIGEAWNRAQLEKK